MSISIPGLDEYVTGHWGDDGYEEPQISHYCDECGEAIYEGEDYYEIEGGIYCEDCVYKMKKTAVLEVC